MTTNAQGKKCYSPRNIKYYSSYQCGSKDNHNAYIIGGCACYYHVKKTFSDTYDIKAVISSAAKTIAHDLDIKPIVVMTESGSTALSISNQRPDIEIVALAPFKKVCQKMTLYWGVEPCISKQFTDQSEMFHEISKFIKKKKSLKKGDSYVIISGLLGVSGKTNMVKIHSI